MKYVIQMITTTGVWYYNGREQDQYDQWWSSVDEAQLYVRQHLANRKAAKLRRAVARLWPVLALDVIEVDPQEWQP